MGKKKITASRWRNTVGYVTFFFLTSHWYIMVYFYYFTFQSVCCEVKNADNLILFSVLPKFDVKIDSSKEVSIVQDEIKAEVCAK